LALCVWRDPRFFVATDVPSYCAVERQIEGNSNLHDAVPSSGFGAGVALIGLDRDQ
jgi:hypothetical protein